MCVEVPPVRISELMQRCVAESKGKLAYNLLPESQLALATPASDDITDEFCFKYCAWSCVGKAFSVTCHMMLFGFVWSCLGAYQVSHTLPEAEPLLSVAELFGPGCCAHTLGSKRT